MLYSFELYNYYTLEKKRYNYISSLFRFNLKFNFFRNTW